MGNYIVLMDCPDQKGLVFRVTQVLFKAGFNIDEQGEFVDQASAHFFMRTRISGDASVEGLIEEIRRHLPGAVNLRMVESDRKKTVVVLVTREPHCLGDMLIEHHFGSLNLDILAVIGSCPDLGELVAKFGIPFHCVPAVGLSRDQHEQKVLELIERYGPQYLVLAKYMRVLSPDLVRRYPQRILNIHHSFLPAFVGARPYHQAFERGVKIIGATAHFVNETLDEGPIVAQDVIPVSHKHSVTDMIQAGRDIEKIVLARALRLVCADRVFVRGNRTVVFD